MKNILLSIVLILSTQQAFSQKFIGDEKEIKAILTNIEKFSSYVMASDYPNIANSYTENAKIFPENIDIIEGRSPIEQYWHLPEGIKTTYHKIKPIEIKVVNNEAYDHGYYEGTTQRANGEEVSWKGKYVIVWKKIDSEWKIYLDIWNGIKD